MFTDKSTFIEWIGTMADRANANSPFGDRETEHFISTLRLTFTNFRQAAGSFKISKVNFLLVSAVLISCPIT